MSRKLKLEFTDNPKHGVVRRLKTKRDEMIAELLKNCFDLVKSGKIKETQSVEEAIEVVAREKPEVLMDFQCKYDEFNELATISLATNRIWTEKELDELSEKEFQELFEKSKEMLGGDAESFLGSYSPLGISMKNSNTA